MTALSFRLVDDKDLLVKPQKAICIGYSGRNQEVVQKHIDELATEGIAAPPEIPMIYPVSQLLVTQDDQIQVLGEKTSGEVEFVVISQGDKKWISLGSDHTDRELEAYSIPYAKQATPKPVAKDAWELSEVLPHWDQIQLSCEIEVAGEWKVYQQGTVEGILPVEKLLTWVTERQALNDTETTVLFCGTVPIQGGTFQFGSAYRMQMHDPVLGETIQLEYTVENIAR